MTDKGREQVSALADNLAATTFLSLYCSPVLRAVQTAEIIGQRFHLTPKVADGLREWDVGTIEGRRYSKETQSLHWEVTAQWLKHGNYDACIEGGESFNDIAARFIPFIDKLAERYGSTDANVLAISHGGTLSCMLPLLLSNIDNGYSLSHGFPYATPIITELRSNEWVCLRWGEEIL